MTVHKIRAILERKSYKFCFQNNHLDFGDPREDCRDAVTLRRNFCNRRINRELFRFQRSVSGICNNLSPGNGTAGAADTPVARLVGRE